jgi:hypothetical protein
MRPIRESAKRDLRIPVIDVFSFKLSDGTQGVTMGNVAADADEARRYWPHYRARTWAATFRGCLPRAAEIHDGLQTAGYDVLRHEWQAEPFPLDDVLRALDADRAAVAAFEAHEPDGAASIAGYLQVFRAGLDAVEAEARRLAVAETRRYPLIELFATGTYGKPEKPAARTEHDD